MLAVVFRPITRRSSRRIPEIITVRRSAPKAAYHDFVTKSGCLELRPGFLRTRRESTPARESQPVALARGLNQGIDEANKVVHTNDFGICRAAYNIMMSRIVRHLLFASVLACHAAVTLCGPCLHALPGSSHKLGASSRSHRSDDSAQPRRDGADNCLICQFVAQGQLLAEISTGISGQHVAELVVPVLPTFHTTSPELPSSPRAPPLASAVLS